MPWREASQSNKSVFLAILSAAPPGGWAPL